jgi:hypothetical protein
MLKDGYRKDLIFLPGVPLLQETAALIQKLGLNVIYCSDAPPVILETGEKFCYGTGIRSYEALGKWQGRYETRLETGIITLDADDLTISCR